MTAPANIQTRTNQRIERSALTRSTRTNERLLLAALQVLGSLGLGALTMSQVAIEAGITRRTLYRHYRHKELLLEALFLFVKDRFEEQFRQAIAETPDPTARLGVISEFTVHSFQQASSRALWQKESRLMLDYFAAHKASSIALMEWALEPLFDDAENTQKIKLDRTMVAEITTRVATSIYLMPWNGDDPDEGKKIIECVILAHLYGTRSILREAKASA